MRLAKRILALLLMALAVFIVCVDLPLPDLSARGTGEEPPPAAISRLYRESDVIAIGVCLHRSDANEALEPSRFMIRRVLDGAAEEGAIMELNAAAEPGSLYLLYMDEGEQGEKELLSEPIPVEGESALFENELVSIASIENDIERQRRIITVPAQSFYYGNLKELASACDEIIVGKVVSVSEPTMTECRAESKGESTYFTVEQVFLRVRVQNGLFGSLRYGEKLDVVLTPYSAASVISATDLTPKTVDPPPASYPKEGSSCIFFLIRSLDKKSSLYFTVNPYEGSVLLIGNTVYHAHYNEAFREINDLRRFSADLKTALYGEEEG